MHAVPLTLTARRALTLPVVIDGAAFTFQLDTGASQTVIARATWQALGLPPGEATETQGAGGSVGGGELVPLAELCIGDARVRELIVGVLDFAELGDRLRGIDGVLGQDVLRRYVTEVDVPSNRFALHARGSTAWRTDNLVAIPYVDALGLIRIAGALDGLPLAAIFDLGAAATIANHRAAPHAIAARSAPVLGADGSLLATATARGRTLAFGDLAFAARDLLVVDLPVFELFGLADEPAVLLGMDLLAPHRIAIDPDACCVYIAP